MSELAAYHQRLVAMEREIFLGNVTQTVLSRAAGAFPRVVRTLDAIHVATALELRERRYPDLVFAWHDRQQAEAAEAVGFQVVGLSPGPAA